MKKPGEPGFFISALPRYLTNFWSLEMIVKSTNREPRGRRLYETLKPPTS